MTLIFLFNTYKQYKRGFCVSVNKNNLNLDIFCVRLHQWLFAYLGGPLSESQSLSQCLVWCDHLPRYIMVVDLELD